VKNNYWIINDNTLLNQGSWRISRLRLWTMVGRWPSNVVKCLVACIRAAGFVILCLSRLIRDEDALIWLEKFDILPLWRLTISEHRKTTVTRQRNTVVEWQVSGWERKRRRKISFLGGGDWKVRGTRPLFSSL